MTYKDIFKRYRNTLTSVIRTARETFLKEKLNERSGNPKKTWETLHYLMGDNTSELPTSINFEGKTVNSDNDIAEEFNEYFTTIGSKLASDIGPSPVSFESFLPEPVPYSFYLKPTTEEEVRDVIKKQKVTSPGFDDINMKII